MYKVKRIFFDKYNPERIFFQGDLITVDDKERLKDILNKGLIEETTEKGKSIELIIKETEMESDTEAETDEKIDFENLTVDEIKNLLDSKGIEYSKKAKKDELLQLLQGVE